MRAAHRHKIRAAIRRFINAHLLPLHLDDRRRAVGDCKEGPPRNFQLFLRNAVNRLRAVDHQFGRADKGVASLRGKDGRIPVLPPADQIRQDFRGSHGGGHPPLLKAGRHIDPRPFFAEQADIGDLVMRHAILRRPAVYGLAGRIKHRCALHQLLKIAALFVFARARARATEQQAALRIPEGKAVLLLADIHPADGRGVFKRQHVGTLLMHTQEEKAGHVNNWEMRGDHHRLCVDHAPGCEHLPRADCRGHGVLVNLHIRNECGEELERMKLRLFRKPHGIGHRERQVRLGHQRGGNAQRLRSSGLPLRFSSTRRAINIGVRFLHGALGANLRCHLPEAVNCLLVCMGVLPRALMAETADEFLINQAVLRRDLCRCTSCYARGDCFPLDHHRIQSSLPEACRRQEARHPAANHDGILFQIPHQGWKMRHFTCRLPNRIHTYQPAFFQSSASYSMLRRAGIIQKNPPYAAEFSQHMRAFSILWFFQRNGMQAIIPCL